MRTKGAVFLLVCILASTAYAQWTELHIAAMEGSVTDVRYLLSSGANVNAVYYDDGSARDQMTPLHAAAIGNDTNVIELLVNAGASVNAREAGDGPRFTLQLPKAMHVPWRSCWMREQTRTRFVMGITHQPTTLHFKGILRL